MLDRFECAIRSRLHFIRTSFLSDVDEAFEPLAVRHVASWHFVIFDCAAKIGRNRANADRAGNCRRPVLVEKDPLRTLGYLPWQPRPRHLHNWRPGGHFE